MKHTEDIKHSGNKDNKVDVNTTLDITDTNNENDNKNEENVKFVKDNKVP